MPTLIFGAETYVMRKRRGKSIGVKEIKCLRSTHAVSRTEGVGKQEVRRRVGVKEKKMLEWIKRR